MASIKWNRKDPGPVIDRIVREFSRDRPVIIPTDTLYGIAAPISSETAMKNIFKLKGRPSDQTLPVAVGALHQLDPLVIIHKWQKTTLRENLPGPVTFILQARGNLSSLIVRDGTIAVRVPRHMLFLDLVKRTGPLALTSANLHGENNILEGSQLDLRFNNDLLVIEDDHIIKGTASEIVDITNREPIIVRKGKVNTEEFMGEDNGRR